MEYPGNTGPIRAGLAGCGRIAFQHFSAISLLGNQIKLMAVCDTDRKRAKEAGLKHNVPFYTDYQGLLKRKDIDLIIISTPNGLHYPMALAAAGQGKNVLVEKPLAINLKQADDLIRTFEEKQLALFVVMQVRYNPALKALKEALEQAKLGKIYNAALTVRWSRPQSYFDQAGWRGSKELEGGALLNQGVHYIDALLWLLGDVKSVYGRVDRVAHNNIEIEDEAFALLSFKSGAYGLIEFTLNAYPGNLECSIAVLGESGTVKLGGKAIDAIEFWQVADCLQPKIEREIPAQFSGVSPNHLFVYQDIVDFFQTGKKPFFEAKEARKSLGVIEAIYASSKKNEEIKL